MQQYDLIPHLFRTEFSRITSVLSKTFGAEHIAAAEDIAGETFLAALETWPYKGIPENPTAWLYAVAKNKARNYLQRRQHFAGKVAAQLRQGGDQHALPDINLSPGNIADSQLQMLFAICHPVLPAGAQAGLALRILCGFGMEEIANAFLTSKETINKRLFRAREKLRQEQIPIEFPPEAELGRRLDGVLTTLYLLYNEGYYSESREAVLREELCLEAMRLTHLLTENEKTNLPAVNALLALMCFHASRFAARRNERGELVLYEDQDEALWNDELIARGAYHFQEAAKGHLLTKYHLEAGIAYWHTIKADTPEKWENILQLYNRLLQLDYSPIAALNRTFALSKVRGKQVAIAEAEKLNLTDNRFYFMLLGELYSGVDNHLAKVHFQQALLLSRTPAERRTIQARIGGC